MPSTRATRTAALLLVLPALVLSAGCEKKTDNAIKETAPPTAASAKPVEAASVRFLVQPAGKVSILIDAPLEKIKGETNVLGGTLDVNPMDLMKATGEVTADLSVFTTTTFGDKSKDEQQTEHARNWFELGEKVSEQARADYKLARFSLKKVTKAEPAKLADAKDEGGKRKVRITAEGTIRVHGREAPKTITLDVTFTGPADAPNGIQFATVEPVPVSLSEHDVKPRDNVGSFLNGALEKVGKKIDDKVQVTIGGEAMAAPAKPKN